jgi:para-nitrobenzyl esterase
VLRKLAVALLVLAGLAGGALYWARENLVAKSEVPPEPARVADRASARSLSGGGEVVGFVGRYGSHVWLGIPYAKPPAGALRWRAPEPPAPIAGVREALAFGNHCPQFASPFAGVAGVPDGAVTGDEDCLYLNVYAPRAERGAAAAKRLPVMMWIHGGGNVIGLSDFYDGGRLARAHDVVVVTVNYRLGPFGFFRHASLREGASPAEQSGNFATLDLVRALEWVRDNAAAFGGDPGNVTIFGESAGGANVFSLLLAPQASGLFHRAIVQSGGVYTDTPAEAENYHDDAEPGHRRSSNEVLLRLLVADGKAADLAAARAQAASMPGAEVAAFLRGQTPARLFAAYEREAQEGLLDMPRMFADGVVRPIGDPHEQFARPDGWNRVPVMLGTNRDENKLFLFVNPLYVRRWLGVLPQVKEPPLYDATADAMAAMWKATGVDGPASAMGSTQPQVFAYRWDWDEEPSVLGLDLGAALGASHGFEIPFVFGHWDLGRQGNVIFTPENRAAREALSEQMMSYWAQFAWEGDPGRGRGGDQLAWAAWDGRPGGHTTLILDTAEGGGLRMGSEPVTPESVIAAVDADPRLRSQRERCWVYRELAQWSRGFDASLYPSAGREGCREYPLDAFPWN